MEKMPYRPELDTVMLPLTTPTPAAQEVVQSDWRHQLPTLRGQQVTLRELRTSDAASLFAMLTTEEVARFISPPPTTVDGFERFIAWTLRQRTAGVYACFAVTLKGYDTAIGIFQMRELEPGFGTAEWGFALGSAFWGTGVFQEGATLMVNFAFETVGVHRLEARAAAKNGRGNGALRKMGAVQEGLLRRSFLRNGEYLDQNLWTILDEDWRLAKYIWEGTIQ
ncbi:MAG: GNAT family N-acetyltransferase [Vicinamibacterales bacterium]